jgi:hypothetical protein
VSSKTDEATADLIPEVQLRESVPMSDADESIFEIPLAQSDPSSDLTPSSQLLSANGGIHETPQSEKKRKSLSLSSASELPTPARIKKSKQSAAPRSKSTSSTPPARPSAPFTSLSVPKAHPTPKPPTPAINLFETVPLIDDDTPSSVRAALLALMGKY